MHRLRDRPVTGHFGIADLPPSLKPTTRVKETKHEVFGRLTQCRTGHGFIGEYYSRFVKQESTSCPCGEPLQTREHLLRECSRYDTHREILREASPELNLGVLLGTPEGIEAVTEFLKASGAFTKTGRPRPQPKHMEYTARSIWQDIDNILATQPDGDGGADWHDEIVDDKPTYTPPGPA